MEIKHYSDGKERSKLDKIKELEKTFGIDVLSPYGTNHSEVFREKIDKMELTEMNALAQRVGARIVADKGFQKELLWNMFRAYQTNNPPALVEKEPAFEKEFEAEFVDESAERAREALDSVRTKSVFEKEFPTDNEESFRKLLNTFTLADLQNLSARCGFNPSFDRMRIVNLLMSEFSKDLKMRPKKV